MNFSRTNREFYERNKEEGKLDSQVKDGPPKTRGQKALAMGYPIVMVFVWLVGFLGAFLQKPKKWNWKTFWVVFPVCSITGLMWGIYIEKIDPNFPGWLFLPWTVSNKEFLLMLEDWTFYPGCALLFYLIFRALKAGQPSGDGPKIAVTGLHITVTCFFCYFSAACGKTLAWQCAIPSLFLFFYAWDKWNLSHYTKFMLLFVIPFEVVWDLVAVSLLSYIPGMAWASQWVYVAFDVSGKATHSSVFLSYNDHPWAWILKNPIEITPWFAVSVGMYFYSMVIATDKFLGRSRPIHSSTAATP